MAFPLFARSQGYKNHGFWLESQGKKAPKIEKRHTKAAPKVILIGWDAADWTHINPLLEAGKMPALQKLLRGGAKGKLASMQPMLSPMLWTTIATGKRPYAHGIHGFAEKDENGEVRPISGHSRKASAFWEIANYHGFRSQVTAWWPSHPAEPIKGEMVSNLYHLNPKGEYPWPMPNGTVYPKELQDALAELRIHEREVELGWMEAFVPGAAQLENAKDDVIIASCMRVLAHALSVQNAATYLLHTRPTDVAAVYFDALDHFCHIGMRYAGTDSPYAGIVEGAYRLQDQMLEGIMAYAGEETHIILLSDHGFKGREELPDQLPDEPSGPEYEHRHHGVLVLKGPQIKADVGIFGAGLADICPTLLALLNIPQAMDMHGKVLQSVLYKREFPQPVASWDDFILNKRKTVNTPGKSDYMQHLVDLGYVDESALDQQSDRIIRENDFYLARSYADAGKFTKCIEVLEKWVWEDDCPLRLRVAHTQAALQSGNKELSGKMLDMIEEELQQKNSVQHTALKAQQLHLEGRAGEAVQLLNDFFEQKPQILGLHLLKSRICLIEDWPDFALEACEYVLQQDPTHVMALRMKGISLMRIDQTDEALEAFFDAVDEDFFQPETHYNIAVLFLRKEMIQNAVQALLVSLEQAPKKKKTQQLLFELAQKGLINADFIEKIASESEEKPIIIVSGLPRSGTSLMMQILESLSVPIMKDEVRKADEHNPKGYYEYGPVKRMQLNTSFLEYAFGKALKIVSPLLIHLPEELPYKIIHMQRPLPEVVNSQLKMTQNPHYRLDLHEKLREEAEKTEQFFAENPGIERYEVSFHQLLSQPENTIKALCNWLDIPFRPEAVSCVNPDLSESSI